MRNILPFILILFSFTLSAQSVQEYKSTLEILKEENKNIYTYLTEIDYLLRSGDGRIDQKTADGKIIFKKDGSKATIFTPERLEEWKTLLSNYYAAINKYKKTAKHLVQYKDSYYLTIQKEKLSSQELKDFLPSQGYLLNSFGKDMYYLKSRYTTNLKKLRSNIKKQLKADCNTCGFARITGGKAFRTAYTNSFSAQRRIDYYLTKVSCKVQALSPSHIQKKLSSLLSINETMYTIIDKEKPALLKEQYNNLIVKRKADKYRKETVYTFSEKTINKSKVLKAKINLLLKQQKAIIKDLSNVETRVHLAGNVNGKALSGTLDIWLKKLDQFLETELENIKDFGSFYSLDITTDSSSDDAIEGCKEYLEKNKATKEKILLVQGLKISIVEED
jgi:hypothetical protein